MHYIPLGAYCLPPFFLVHQLCHLDVWLWLLESSCCLYSLQRHKGLAFVSTPRWVKPLLARTPHIDSLICLFTKQVRLDQSVTASCRMNNPRSTNSRSSGCAILRGDQPSCFDVLRLLWGEIPRGLILRRVVPPGITASHNWPAAVGQ